MTKKFDLKSVIIVVLLLLLALETFFGFSYINSIKSDTQTSIDITFDASTMEEIDELRNQGKAVIVVFDADYCPTCINYKPYVKEIANLYQEDVIVKYVDTVDHEEIRKEYNIELIPSTIFFDKDGNVYKPALDLNVTSSNETIDERRYVSDDIQIADVTELNVNQQFEYGINQDQEIVYCKFVGLLDLIQFEEIIIELIQ